MQAGNPVPLESIHPTREFFIGEHVAFAGFVRRHRAGSYREHNRQFAPRRPSNASWRQECRRRRPLWLTVIVALMFHVGLIPVGSSGKWGRPEKAYVTQV